ncbi:hypothetical protein [Streptomyces sp. S186]|uniref:hypothetical protein n=1 Tax=Streptomyces sp. S186 TaxID=3434395 RepID=UPI003F67E026
MFETRHDERENRWYVVSSPDGHLAHVEGEDGRMYGAFFDTEAEADKCTHKLNAEAYKAAMAYQEHQGGKRDVQ